MRVVREFLSRRQSIVGGTKLGNSGQLVERESTVNSTVNATIFVATLLNSAVTVVRLEWKLGAGETLTPPQFFPVTWER